MGYTPDPGLLFIEQMSSQEKSMHDIHSILSKYKERFSSVFKECHEVGLALDFEIDEGMIVVRFTDNSCLVFDHYDTAINHLQLILLGFKKGLAGGTLIQKIKKIIEES